MHADDAKMITLLYKTVVNITVAGSRRCLRVQAPHMYGDDQAQR
jgi:hypothetical protein